MGGEVCAHLDERRRAQGAGPACMCYDSDYEQVLRECTSPCPRQEEEEEEDDDDGEKTCAADDHACHSAAAEAETRLLRFLLYDVKIGEGFNLQREVFPRMGWVVWKLNEDVLQRCGGAFGRGSCAEWALVLPPWCRLAHWRTEAAHVPWRELFDLSALRSPRVKVLEFDEYTERAGGPYVDLAVTHTEDRIPKDERQGQRKGFYGWAARREACRDLASHHWSEAAGRWTVSYSGECDGGIQALDYRCGALSSPMPRDAVDMVLAAGKQATSVLIKRADGIAPASVQEMDSIGLREAMLFSSAIRQAGEDFIAERLQGEPFLAVHCRRTDFLRAHAGTTPDPEAVARQINAVLEERKYDRVFVATDAPGDLREQLQAQVRGAVHFLDSSEDVAARFQHPGQLAAVEMWIAALADFFIGTQESRFTAHIQLERSWLGKRKETSERELCKAWASSAAKPCVAPGYRHSGRKGEQHQRYWAAALL